MREIKFRAWNSRYGMNREATLLALSTFNCRENGIHTTEVSWPKDTVFMQFTGLKDKNGKEIWEGDIIKSKFVGGKPIHVVYEDAKAAFMLGHDQYFLGFVSNRSDEIEVIGNIYENPDLLK